MTIFLIILFFALLPFAPVYVSATAPVVTEDGEELGNITLVAARVCTMQLLRKFSLPRKSVLCYRSKILKKGMIDSPFILRRWTSKFFT